MKRAINKNVKRATALALSLTMVLGMSLTSFAEGEYNVYDEIDEAIIIDDNEVAVISDRIPIAIRISDQFPDGVVPVPASVDTYPSGSSDSNSVPAEPAEMEDAKELKEIKLSPNMFREGAIQKNEEATEAVGSLIKSDEKAVVLELHQDDLNAMVQSLGENGVDKLLKDTKTNLEGIESNLKDAEAYQKSADEKLTTVLDTNKDAIDAAAKSASDNADSAKVNVTTANSADTLDAATSAKAAAEADLTAANNDLATVTLAYNTASANVEEVSKQLKEAEEDYAKAYEKVEKAKEELKNAKTNSDAALADLKKAEEEMAALDKEVKDLAASQAELSAMQDQYYAMMVQYFRDTKCAVYDEKGNLDVAASSAKIDQDKIDEKAVNTGNDIFELGRYLMTQLVTYMINNNENVDPKTADISFVNPKNGKTNKPASRGIAFESDAKGVDASGNIVSNVDQTAIYGHKVRKDSAGNEVVFDDTMPGRIDLYQESTTLKDNGRTNMFYVTYTDKDGNRTTEYFNYVFKSSKDLKEGESKVDIENGMVYLAVIKTDATGTTLEAVDDENNYSNYSKLMQALELANKAKNLKDQYDNALAAVQAAQARTQDLVDQIAKIKISDLAEKNVKLEELKDALKKANEELDKAKEDKTNIEDKIKEVQKAIDEIDLTRFNVVTTGDDTPVTEDGEGTPATPAIPATPATPAAFDATAPAADAPAQADDAAAGNDDTVLDITDEDSATAATAGISEDDGTATRPVFTITDEASATAPSVEETGANLWWLLLLLLLALMIAFAIYKYAENKRNAEISK